MIEAELFDTIELLVDVPEHNLRAGMLGAIVECYPDHSYEVEFSDRDGETIALCPLPPEQFIVVWKAKTKTWLSVSEQIIAMIDHLPDEPKQEVLNFARFLYDRMQRPRPKPAEFREF